ncbi:MAG TPA: DUF1802 family protein [Phycisphaerae bacterium]|nr:DUF1802 family protein [Phycisphaerae bacterium]
MDTLHIALKEWDLTIRELLAGRQIVLLRKGGILESDNQFELEHPRFLFYPTFIHQNPEMVKPEKRAAIRRLAAEPAEVEITGYGEAARIWEVPSRRALESLDDLHVWDAPLLDLRFAYRPEKPLYLVAVRAYSLPAPVRLANTPAYAGCKSWVPLEQEISVEAASPALEAAAFEALVRRIERTFAGAR